MVKSELYAHTIFAKNKNSGIRLNQWVLMRAARRVYQDFWFFRSHPIYATVTAEDQRNELLDQPSVRVQSAAVEAVQ
jgi:hypothetical protein